MRQKCGTCGHFEPMPRPKAEDGGRCVLNPPVPIIVDYRTRPMMQAPGKGIMVPNNAAVVGHQIQIASVDWAQPAVTMKTDACSHHMEEDGVPS